MRPLLKFIAGAVVAMAIWWFVTPSYDALLCSVLQRVGVSATAAGRAVNVTRAGGPSIRVPADQLTYNIILFAGLLAAVPPRRAWRAVAALVAVLAFHTVALYTTVQATYAVRAGPYSDAHYSTLAQDFWNSTDFIYRIGGMFAIAFVAWYAATASDRARESPPEASKAGPRRAPASRRDRSSFR